MSEKRRKIRNEFVVSWESKREQGKVGYIRTGIIKCFMFCIAIEVVEYLFTAKLLTSMTLIIYSILSILAPMINWFVNESRYRLLCKE